MANDKKTKVQGWNFAKKPSRLNLRFAAKLSSAKQAEVNRKAKAAKKLQLTTK